jgi:hypothetical protein
MGYREFSQQHGVDFNALSGDDPLECLLAEQLMETHNAEASLRSHAESLRVQLGSIVDRLDAGRGDLVNGLGELQGQATQFETLCGRTSENHRVLKSVLEVWRAVSKR